MKTKSKKEVYASSLEALQNGSMWIVEHYKTGVRIMRYMNGDFFGYVVSVPPGCQKYDWSFACSVQITR